MVHEHFSEYADAALGSPISVLSEGFVSGISVITDVALGLIAFSVGGQLHFSYMRRAGKAPVILALVESVAAAVCVSLALMLTGNGPGMALIMGSIAAATAPAATILVVQQYRARGPVTNLLLQVVALDDVTALLLYSISAAVIKHFGAEGKQILAAVLKEVLRFMEGAALGLLLAILLLFVLRFFRRRSNRLAIVCGFLFLAIGGAQRLGLNALIVCMVMGMAIANLSAEADAVLECVEPIGDHRPCVHSCQIHGQDSGNTARRRAHRNGPQTVSAPWSLPAASGRNRHRPHACSRQCAAETCVEYTRDRACGHTDL